MSKRDFNPRVIRRKQEAAQRRLEADALGFECELGCGCVVLGDQYSIGEQYIWVRRFFNYCVGHVFSATAHVESLPAGILYRTREPDQELHWFKRDTGAHVSKVEMEAHREKGRNARREAERPAREAEATRVATEVAKAEAFVSSHGWVKEGKDAWTAPEELRTRRHQLFDCKLSKYVSIPLGYAINVINQQARYDAAQAGEDGEKAYQFSTTVHPLPRKRRERHRSDFGYGLMSLNCAEEKERPVSAEVYDELRVRVRRELLTSALLTPDLIADQVKGELFLERSIASDWMDAQLALDNLPREDCKRLLESHGQMCFPNRNPWKVAERLIAQARAGYPSEPGTYLAERLLMGDTSELPSSVNRLVKKADA